MADRIPHVHQLDGSRLAGYNCNCAVTAGQVGWATGDKPPTGAAVRAKVTDDRGSPDTSGGTTLAQVDDAANRGWHVDPDVRAGGAAIEFERLVHDHVLAKGQMANLSVGYVVIRGTEHDAFSGRFAGNHAMGLGKHGDLVDVSDPGADGRRPDVPNGLQTYEDLTLLRDAAAALVVGGSDAHPRRLGRGWAWASLVDQHVAAPPPKPTKPSDVRYRYGGEPRFRGDYVVQSDVGLARVRVAPSVGSVVARTVRGGRPLPFHVAQTTWDGSRVDGSTMWHGSADGTLWVHHSLVAPK